MFNAKRKNFKILFQKVNSRKCKLYHNEQRNVNHNNKSRLLKNIHLRSKKKIIIYTNYKRFLSILYDKELNQKQLKWAKKIIHYDFEIKHIKEIDNTIVDTLSRKANYETTKKISRSLLKRNETILEKAKASKKIWDIMRQTRDSKTSKHQKVIKTLKRVQKTTNMHVLKKHVEKYIKSCSKCAMTKIDRLDQIKKFQLLKSFEHSYQNIALNFITKLSKSNTQQQSHVWHDNNNDKRIHETC